MQRQFKHPKCCRITDFTICGNRCNGGVIRAARPGDDFTYTIDRIQSAGKVLRREPFIDMVMPVQDQVSMAGVQQIPECLAIGGGPTTGTIKRNMPICEGALVRMGCQVGLQPIVLS